MSDVEVERLGDIAIVRLNRPDALNAQTPQMWGDLVEVGQGLAGSAKAAVLTGSGTSFSAGLDKRMFTPEGVPGAPSLLDLAQRSDDEVLAQIAIFQAAFSVWTDAPYVTIAAVEGHAIGAGFQLALACDVIVAGHSASFAMKEVQWGLVPDLTGTAGLIERLGRSRALQACVTGQSMSSAVPGLVDIETQDGEALATATQMAQSLPAAELAAAHKNLLNAYQQAERHAQRERERRAQLDRIRALAAVMRHE